MTVKKEQLNLLQRIWNFSMEDVSFKKSKKAHGYNYAPLDKILPAIKPLLNKHGIGFYHRVHDSDNAQHLITTIFNLDDVDDAIKSSNAIKDDVKLPGQNVLMTIGSSITYYRRYHLCAMLNLIADTDTDAGGARPTNSTSKAQATDTSKKEVNYVEIFSKQLKTKKTKENITKMFESYKTQIPAEQQVTITGLIEEKFK